MSFMSDHIKLIKEFQGALEAEIEELRRRGVNQRLVARDGRFQESVNGQHIYIFRLRDEPNYLFDDAACELRRKEEPPVLGTVLSIVGCVITLALQEHIGPTVPEAVIVIDPSKLLELLKAHLGALDSRTCLLSLSMLGFREIQAKAIQPPIALDHLNEQQRAAVALALGSSVTYVWGPPGTGKTTTLGYIVLSLLHKGFSVLLTAHTNVAVDQALIHCLRACQNDPTGQELYQQGKILRLGTAQLDTIRHDPKVNLDDVANVKTAALRAERDRLKQLCKDKWRQRAQVRRHMKMQRQQQRELLSNLESLRAEESRLVDTLAEADRRLRVSKSEAKRIDEDLRRIQVDIRRLEDTAKTVEARLRQAQVLGTFGRLVRGLSLRRLKGRLTRLHEELRGRINQLESLRGQYRSVAGEVEKARKDRERLRSLLDEVGEHVTRATRQMQKIESELQRLQEEHQQLTSEIEEIDGQLAIIAQQVDETHKLVMQEARLVATTLTRTYTMDEVKSRSYEVLVCDEASMAPIPMMYAAGALARLKGVIIGDFRQLGPIAVADTPAVEQWLRRDIFQVAGLVTGGGAPRSSKPMVMLQEQYRMPLQISRIVNSIFYNGQLVDRVDFVSRNADGEPCPGTHIALYDTSRLNLYCTRTTTKSRINLYSAILSFRLAIRALRSFPPSASGGENRPTPEVAIVTPYRGQSRLLNSLIYETGLSDCIVASTVHRFQGQEKEVIIIDLVDGPPYRLGRLLRGGLGSDAARLINVACSRARSKLIFVCHLTYFESKLMSRDIVGRVLQQLRRQGAVIPCEDIEVSAFDADVAGLDAKVTSGKREQIRSVRIDYYTQHTAIDTLIADVERAERSVVILSPFLASSDPTRLLVDRLRRRRAEGLIVKVTTQRSTSERARQIVEELTKAGIDVSYRNYMSAKEVYIDDRVLWCGSLNVLSSWAAKEAMIRIEASRFVREAMGHRGLSHLVDTGSDRLQSDDAQQSRRSVIGNLPASTICECSGTMHVRPKSRHGPFYACGSCSQKRDAKGLILVDEEYLTCDECEAKMLVRVAQDTGRPFLGCSNYPNCKFTRTLTIRIQNG